MMEVATYNTQQIQRSAQRRDSLPCEFLASSGSNALVACYLHFKMQLGHYGLQSLNTVYRYHGPDRLRTQSQNKVFRSCLCR
jgi:hypothetical protein